MAIFNKIKSLSKILDVEVFVFCASNDIYLVDSTLEYPVEKIAYKNTLCYLMKNDGVVVHKSFVYKNVWLLRLIKKSGMVIGSCFTDPHYRGRGIYARVISHIAKEIDSLNIYMIVDVDNVASIKGIEKAGFKKLAYIKAKKWTVFYFNKSVKTFEI